MLFRGVFNQLAMSAGDITLHSIHATPFCCPLYARKLQIDKKTLYRFHPLHNVIHHKIKLLLCTPPAKPLNTFLYK